jgi:hypothetical protein
MLLLERYGKQLELKMINDASDDFANDSKVHKNREGHLKIPISFNSHFFATAVIKEADDLNEEDQASITSLVQMILEPTFYSWFLDHQKPIATVASPIHHLSLVPDTEASAEPEVWCLESLSTEWIKKVALRMHELSERWAFIEYKDISDQIFSVRDLSELGQVTLVIPDWTQLYPFHRNIIAEYLRTPVENSWSSPLVLVGTTKSLDALHTLHLMSEDVLNRVSTHHLRLDRLPTDFSRLEEVLKMLLEGPDVDSDNN